ncbi:MAG: hypothetical protein U9N77_04830 [Thermodesulfobacteriota bacterium]|nr:hypothetical protein [Thermodesulfobacteriota bacterium]
MSDNKSSTPRMNRTIVLPFDQANYHKIVEDPKWYRQKLDEFIDFMPELFPAEVIEGYWIKEKRISKKLKVPSRRIIIGSTSYTVRPAHVMPYHTAYTDEIEKAMFLRKFGVPFWALSYVFGKDHSFWYRIEQSLGKNSIVGTTIKDHSLLPEHVVADEKHSRMRGKKVYIPTTVASQCILGVSVTEDAGEKTLTKAYGVFKDEANDLNPAYSPVSVNTDGWKATINAWKSIFPSISVLCCFLHVFIKIRDRSQKKYRDFFNVVAESVWNCYKAENKATFSQRVRRLYESVKKQNVPQVILNPIKKMKDNISKYSKAYDLPGCHRTSNMIDRLMQRMDRHLFSTFYFHGSLASAKLSIRGWALIHNFAPCNPTTVKKHNGWRSPAEKINQFRYHDCWLQNMLISASLGGFRNPPPNP